MATQVKIIQFSSWSQHKAESTLETLVNQGWKIVSSAGASSFPQYIVILQRDEPAGV